MTKKNIISPIENGPLHVTGALELKNVDGETIETTEELYLCRCGHSKNKPYCDGEHKKNNFQENGEFKKPPASEDDMANEGVLEIKVQANGPLIFRGAACIKDTSGQEIMRKVGGLCRCGNSSNDPFCDGTHAKVEFIAE